jgi:hypothetical protein
MNSQRKKWEESKQKQSKELEQKRMQLEDLDKNGGKGKTILYCRPNLIDPKINFKNLQLPKDSIHFPDIF